MNYILFIKYLRCKKFYEPPYCDIETQASQIEYNDDENKIPGFISFFLSIKEKTPKIKILKKKKAKRIHFF